MSYKIHKGKYYYDLGYTFNRLKKKSGKCFVCGSRENLEPHHLKQVKASKPDYCEENNLVVICKSCHRRYHSRYKKVNPKTFAEFIRKMSGDNFKDNTIEQLRKNNKKLKNENFKLKSEIEELEDMVFNRDNDYKCGDVFSNAHEELKRSILKAHDKANDKIREMYDELSDEDKIMIPFEEFQSYFIVDIEDNFSISPNNNTVTGNLVLRFKTPEEILNTTNEE